MTGDYVVFILMGRWSCDGDSGVALYNVFDRDESEWAVQNSLTLCSRLKPRSKEKS